LSVEPLINPTVSVQAKDGKKGRKKKQDEATAKYEDSSRLIHKDGRAICFPNVPDHLPRTAGTPPALQAK